MKAYYHAHESAYQEIKSKGYVGWGNAKNLSELGDDKTNAYLSSIVSKYFPNTDGKKVLDVGCGSGTTAFTFAKLGLAVTGIDISETAIQMGKDLARQQNLSIAFEAADILKTNASLGKFDLIYDSHCLHCIVFEEDRAATLSNIKNLMTDGGVFILDTMVLPNEKVDTTELFQGLRFDQNFILWHKTKPSSTYGVEEFDGQYWCAQRRIYPADTVIEEVKKTGFQILSQQMDDQPGKPSMLRLVLR